MNNEFRFVNVRMTFNERTALYRLAAQDRRDIRDEAAILIRERLIVAGLLDASGEITFTFAPALSAQPLEATP